MNLTKLAKYALAGWLPGGRRQCIMCGHRVWRFMPYMSCSLGGPGLMHVIDMIGSNPDQFECPRCGAHDRERHLLMYLEKTGLLAGFGGKSVLHFAPEKRLSRRIAATEPTRYVLADLYPGAPQVQRVDMLQMQFESQSFDVVIANHVLEHVDDDLKALGEIYRVLKPDGYAILQTPYSAKLHRTWQDSGIDDDAARLQAYGQSDHVRLFGQDIFARFASSGLLSCVRHHDDVLADVDAATCGINPKEPLFLFQRPGDP
ncbi:MAG: class I SAM-dependent methyltransferase [Rhodanobacter sp.]|nr:MAG: class I SAM-dependent methyltransferase [Rhodanobacter sp.]